MLILELAALLVRPVAELSRQVQWAFPPLQHDAGAVPNPPFPLDHPKVEPGWRQALERTRALMPGEHFLGRSGDDALVAVSRQS